MPVQRNYFNYFVLNILRISHTKLVGCNAGVFHAQWHNVSATLSPQRLQVHFPQVATWSCRLWSTSNRQWYRKDPKRHLMFHKNLSLCQLIRYLTIASDTSAHSSTAGSLTLAGRPDTSACLTRQCPLCSVFKVANKCKQILKLLFLVFSYRLPEFNPSLTVLLEEMLSWWTK